MDIKRRFILTIVLLSYFVTAINGAIVITGLTDMAEELGLNQSALSWVQRTYLQPIITQYFIDNKSEIWLLFLIAHSKR